MADGLWCEKHQAQYFKKGKMKGYAHPITDDTGITSGWCNMPEESGIVTEAVKQGAEIESVKKSTSKYKADPDKTASIENQVCLKLAVECYIADKIKAKDISVMYQELKGIING